ncbi:DUF4298 domain-containing protein [Allobaculum mucilyticum]|uniref:DUF4298 domain-containing protein n=1 Tax=Allobaculum mucilyticum TaxID=2834459 RepID=UPI001E4D295D|nr:DUF4298 domain-containing protein [Allobaculum mucilyticum]UNT95242.1 DUF4298 domain-containing protein [Allobaculum mucilyticum]
MANHSYAESEADFCSRITREEDKMNELLSLVQTMNACAAQMQRDLPSLSQLLEWYENPQWLGDHDRITIDPPENLRCGVLSEDGLYDLFADISEEAIELEKLCRQLRTITRR